MRWTFWLLALCACNQVFDLRATKSVDARHEYFDAPIDAPYACPPPGETPQFAPLFHQVILQNCRDYSASVARHVGLALCDPDYDGNYVLDEGPIDGPLSPLAGFEDPSFMLQFLRASADGEEMFLMYFSTTAGYEIRTFRRTSNGWERRPNFAALAAYSTFSNPTDGPMRHALRTDTMGRLLEFAEDAAGNWTQVAIHTTVELGASAISSPRLTGDGLHLTMSSAQSSDAVTHMVYSDRASLSDPFRPVTRLDGIPLVQDQLLTEDCGRIYFSGLESIFYVQRL